jgi:hypothetical protein
MRLELVEGQAPRLRCCSDTILAIGGGTMVNLKLGLLATLLVLASVACPAWAATPLPGCAAPPQTVAAGHPMVVTINPATAWQPRGGLVLVEIRGDATILAGLILRACIGWVGPEGAASTKEAAVERRASDRTDIINIGVELPDIQLIKGSWPDRIWHGQERFTGLGIVPLANLRILGANESGVVLDETRQVGITSLWYATITALACVIGAIALLHELARRRGVLANVAPLPGRLPGQMLLLRLITASNGRASLSQLQVLLWTFVVGASSVYVMCLSGDLIDVTNGTLALLGIAGASSLLAASQKTSGGGAQPSWTDLTAPEDGSPGTDVKRLQMLIFTLISAAFVLVKVLTSYVIPDIPNGYLLLMGISNGVYIGGKFTQR